MTVKTFPVVFVPDGTIVCGDCGAALPPPTYTVTTVHAPTPIALAPKPPIGYALPITAATLERKAA